MRVWALLAALLALPAGASEEAEVAMTARPVVSEIVDLRDSVAGSFVGTVSARVEVNLGFPMIGTIAERPVEEGDIVKEGDVLARLDPEDFNASVRAAEAGVAVAEAQANSARDARDRARELAGRGVGTQTQLDDAQRALVAALARLEQARASLAQAQDTRDLATLRAPRDGVVTTVHEQAGTTLSAGQPVLQLSGTDDREAVIDLSEKDAAALQTGTEFTVRLVANPDVVATARLDRIDPVAEASTRTRRAHLLLQSPPDGFRLGALVHAAPAGASGGAIVLPKSAILDAETGPAVWVIDRDDDTVHRTPIQVGEQTADFAVVTSGLSAGDEVVTRGIHSLRTGQTVGPRLSE